MRSLIPGNKMRSLLSVFSFAFLLASSASIAAAADSGNDADRDGASPRNATRARRADASSAEVKTPTVLYVAFDGAASASPEANPEPATRPRTIKVEASVDEAALPMPTSSSFPLPPQASTAPMTAREKFGYWFHSRFLSWGSYASAAVTGGLKELQDNDDFKKDTVGNFFADAGTRAVRSFTFGATSGFYEKAVLASLFRQDPRYHRSQRNGNMARIIYASTRVFITQGDRCACSQFNASFLLGGAAAAVTANLWERRERTGPIHTVGRFYTHVGITAFFNVVKEFLGGR